MMKNKRNIRDKKLGDKKKIKEEERWNKEIDMKKKKEELKEKDMKRKEIEEEMMKEKE